MKQLAGTTPSPSATVSTAAQPVADGHEPIVSDAESREVMVRLVAYSLYERRGSVAGHELEDWLQAEREVGREMAAANLAAAHLAAPNQPTEAQPAAKEPAVRL